MTAVLTEEPRLEKENTNVIPEDGDDEVEDLQEVNEVSTSKKKKKKKKKKKGQFSLIVKHFENEIYICMTMQLEVSVSLNLLILFNSEFYLSLCIFVFCYDRKVLYRLVGLLFFLCKPRKTKLTACFRIPCKF